MTKLLENAKILYDWDNYQTSLIDYQYMVYRNDSDSMGFYTKVEEIRQFNTKTSEDIE